MPVDPARVKSLFLAASELADPANRAAYLDRECGGDAELRERVEALLRANDSAPLPPVVAATMDSVVGQPQTEDLEDRAAQVGAIIAGKYTLAEVIGEGGMGSVWRAKQSEPVKRFVAVKLIKAGMDSRQVLARFDAERQALALMDHPNIAKVLDGGLHERRPFFVMELVKGVPITEYCDAQKLTPQQRLELFVPVCQAIQHAHQKGIVHRDIKPSNVLVALYDDKPVVKVIDFGVAKATGGALTEATIDTGFGSVVGTPEYMSPEQATFNNLDIDTCSDVYALGVLLYELLAGSPPFTNRELEKKGLLEMLRVVREEEPPRPSTKLSTNDALPSLSANRGTEPKKLTGLLRNELDWIVMKALEKDRARRYETANGFAADVQRYLAGEPVQAHPPSTAYRLKKFVRRNRPQVIAVSLVLLALVGGVVGTSVGLFEAKKQARLAVAAADKERQAKEREVERAEGERLAKLDAEAKKIEAQQSQVRAAAGEKLAGERLVQVEAEKAKAVQEQQIAQAVKNFLQTKLLAQAATRVQADTLLKAGGASSEAKLNPTIRELLDRAAKELAADKIEANFPNQPLVQAEILLTVGIAYQGVGEASTAIPFLTRSVELSKAKLGPDHPNTLTSMNSLALGYYDAGQFDKALPLLEETLELRKAKFGPDQPDTLTSMNNLAGVYQDAGQLNKALPLFEETLELTKAKLGPDHPDNLTSMCNLASSYQAAGQLDKALPLFEETVRLSKAKLGPDHPNTLGSMNHLAGGYLAANQLDKALPLLDETLKLQKAKLGPDHPDTLSSMSNLAASYQAAGQLDKALPLFEETVRLSKAKLGPDHPNTLGSIGSLAMGYEAAARLDKALPLFEETLKLTKAKLGPDHPLTLGTMSNLAAAYQDAGQLDKALPLLEEALKLRKAKLGPDHPHTFDSMNNLWGAYQAAGQFDKAQPLHDEMTKLEIAKSLPLLEKQFKVAKAKLGPDHLDTLSLMTILADGYRAAGQLDKALPLFEELLSLQEKNLGRTHADTQLTVANLGMSYKDAGRVAEAIPLLEEVSRASKMHPALRKFGTALLDVYAKAGKPAEARKLMDEMLADSPKDSPQSAQMMTQFGLNLLEMKGYVEAEPLLREAFGIREKTQPDAWTTFNTQSLLGGALLGRKKYADAEPLLLKGYEGMKAREQTIPSQGKTRIPDALDRLIELNTATDKPDEVKKWQAERAKYPQANAPEEDK